MNNNVRLWIEALRSGKYTQTKEALKENDSYCCLGVACDLYRRQTKVGKWGKSKYDRSVPFFAGQSSHSGILPWPVANWLGITSRKGVVEIQNGTGSKMSVSSLDALNDAGMSFDEIADIIEGKHEIYYLPFENASLRELEAYLTPKRYIDNGFFRLSVHEAKHLCGGKLPKHGHEHVIDYPGNHKAIISRTVVDGKNVWSIHTVSPF